MSTILIADDVEENRYLLEALLKGHGHNVIAAENGKDALEKAQAAKPDLILSDVLMPVMDGFELCRQIKNNQQLASIPFVFYTATYTDPKDVAFGLGLGADRYLIKPIEPEPLMQLLQTILDESVGTWKRQTEIMLEDNAYLREHREALVRKLEAKMAQLEDVNNQLKREIEERRQAEARLQRLYAAIENTAECIIISDMRGIVEYVNPAFEQKTGLARAEIMGRSLGANDLAAGRDHFLLPLWEAIQDGDSWRGCIKHGTAEEQNVEFEAAVSPILDASGHASGYVSVLMDMTRQRKLEEQLRQAQKMEAIGTLAGGIAHDFNNILSIIVGYTSLVSQNTAQGSETARSLAAVLNSCDRAKNLVKRILMFSRKAERLLVEVDLGPLIKDEVKLLRAVLPSTIEIRTRLEAESGMIITGDPVQMHQVILNIATNAAHAMRERGGILELALQRARVMKDSIQTQEGVPSGDYLQLAITDTGTGMDPETLSRIFEPFFTTKEQGEGTGLGLAVVHGIVQSHGGTLQVKSTPGHGSTFTIYLPAAESVPEQRHEGGEVILRGGMERILFVDDEEQIVLVGEQMLKRFGYQVTTSTSGVGALEMFRVNPFAFDVVITDQTMPHMTGDRMAMEMLRVRPELPVLLCTGYSTPATEKKASDIGVRKVLMKPVEMKTLITAVRSVLDGKNTT